MTKNGSKITINLAMRHLREALVVGGKVLQILILLAPFPIYLDQTFLMISLVNSVVAAEVAEEDNQKIEVLI